MAIDKINERNKVIFGKTESVAGTYEDTMAATDCLAATAITGSATFETASYQYLGDSTSRDEFTYLKDNYADITVETPQQVLGTLNPALTVDDLPLGRYFECCGADVAVNGGTGVVTITNSVAEVNKLSANFVKTSSDNAAQEKMYRFFNMLGICDVSADVGDLPKLKFNLKGNVYDPISAAIVAPDFGNQTTYVASSIRLASIVHAKVTPYGENFNAQSTISGTPSIARTGTTATVTLTSHGLTTGRKVSIRGVTGAGDAEFFNGDFIITVTDANTFTYTMNGTPTSASASGTILVKKDGWAKSFCFSTLQAPNAFGFDLARYLTACEEGFDRKPVPTDVNISMLETFSAKIKATSITKSGATITVVTPIAHGLTTGDSVTIRNATDSLYNLTVLVTVSDSTTFTYTTSATPSANAVAATAEGLIVIKNNDTNFDPDANILGFFAAELKFGTEAGKYTTYAWDKLQISNVKEGKVATSEGRDVTFRNTAHFTITMS
jgi:hypothetical protein